MMSVCLLASCKNESVVYGKWNFRELKINGVTMDSMLLSGDFIELNTDGTYSQKLFGARESGNFAISKDTLKLFCTSDTQVAHKYYLMFLIDSFHLKLTNLSSKNSLIIRLARI
jgi:hypothetical protein